MDVSQALNIINDWKPSQVATLADLLPIALMDEASKRNAISSSKNGRSNGVESRLDYWPSTLK